MGHDLVKHDLAKFAKIANWLRNSLALLFFLLPILSSIASHFLHFAFVFTSIFGLVDG